MIRTTANSLVVTRIQLNTSFKTTLQMSAKVDVAQGSFTWKYEQKDFRKSRLKPWVVLPQVLIYIQNMNGKKEGVKQRWSFFNFMYMKI